jgi:hypothetical protein
MLPVDKSLGTVVTERIVDLFFMLALLGVIFLIQFDLLYNFIQEYLQKNQSAASWGFH